jgi:hypothetical protein
LSCGDSLDVADIPQGGDEFGSLLRRGRSGNFERGERHAVKLLVIFRIIGGDQQLVGIESGPHGFADAACEV